MNDHLQTALTEARAVAATAKRGEQIIEGLHLYSFKHRPLLFVCASEHATRDELARQIIGQFAVSMRQRQAVRDLETLSKEVSQ